MYAVHQYERALVDLSTAHKRKPWTAPTHDPNAPPPEIDPKTGKPKGKGKGKGKHDDENGGG